MRFSGKIPIRLNGLFASDMNGSVQSGAPDDTASKASDPPGQAAFRIHKGPKGKYYWLHETNLYRNPVFLFLVWKIFFFIWLGVAAFILILTAWKGSPIEVLGNLSLPLFYVLIFILVLITFSYWVYALLMGGKYSVLFEMDEKGVTHTQLPKQFKKAEGLAVLAALAGLTAKSPGAAGAGLLAAGSQSMRSDFKRLRAVKASRRRCTIKLRSGDLMHNQVYTAPEDFDFVLAFIRARSGQARFRPSVPSSQGHGAVRQKEGNENEQ